MKWQQSDIGKNGWLTKEASEELPNERVVYGVPGDEAILSYTEEDFIYLRLQMSSVGRTFIVRVPHDYFSTQPLEAQSRI